VGIAPNEQLFWILLIDKVNNEAGEFVELSYRHEWERKER